MKSDQEKVAVRPQIDRIEDDTIILDGEGQFPKKIIIFEAGKRREYRIVKTRNGGYLLN